MAEAHGVDGAVRLAARLARLPSREWAEPLLALLTLFYESVAPPADDPHLVLSLPSKAEYPMVFT